MAAIDLRAHLEATTRNVYNRMVNDLKAVPEDKQNLSPGGCARAPLHYVAECAAMNGFIATYLSTGQMPDRLRANREERDRFLASFDTAEKAIAYLTEQTETLFVKKPRQKK